MIRIIFQLFVLLGWLYVTILLANVANRRLKLLKKIHAEAAAADMWRIAPDSSLQNIASWAWEEIRIHVNEGGK